MNATVTPNATSLKEVTVESKPNEQLTSVERRVCVGIHNSKVKSTTATQQI